MRLLLIALSCLSIQQSALAQSEACSYHNGIPIYCDSPVQTRMEMGVHDLAKFVPIPTEPLFGLPVTRQVCNASGFGNVTCTTGQQWFYGPDLTLVADSDVKIIFHFFTSYNCAAPAGSLCSQGYKPAAIAKLELLVNDAPLVPSAELIIGGANLTPIDSGSPHTRAYELSGFEQSELNPGLKRLYLNRVLPAGARVSLKVTPLSSTTFSLGHVTIMATAR